ncbi:hypothetical protein UlMin_024016 [Ulmus minor]
MAETFLAPIIEKLLDFLGQEVNLTKRVHKEVESLKDELEIIQPFLKDAEAELERDLITSGAMKAWVKQIREEANHIEDVIDEHLSFAGQNVHSRGLISFVKSLKSRYDMVSEIQEIKESLKEIKDRGHSYVLRGFEQEGSRSIDPRLGSYFIEEDELVGIESTSKELKRRLIEGECARLVISLVGEGGLGKTTLVRNVYNGKEVEAHFDFRGWITVSRGNKMERLLKALARKIHPATERVDVEEIDTIHELVGAIRQSLMTKRYVVVFDDVWRQDFWEVLKHAFPDNKNGSRIIITTRNTKVASFCKETPFDLVQELQAWSSDLAWELFCKKAFRDEFKGHCPEMLQHLSKEIVSKCQGLPLVISTIAGLLSTKEKLVSEWENVLLEFETSPQLTSISKILSLSYIDLPHHLKPCFLYFGIFPEDYIIYDRRLYRLWIAEGFIQERRGKTLEQVAEEYLTELIDRNVVSFEVFANGVARKCRVHDLMREIIQSRAEDLDFYEILDENKSRFGGKRRRVSIHGCIENAMEDGQDSSVRCVSVFGSYQLTKSFLCSLFEKFKLLKVLDLEKACFDDLPLEVGNLFHLKYLGLRSTPLKKLPKSIGKLQNLQVLDVRDTLVQELPIEINMLQNLRHLLAYFVTFDLKQKTILSGVRIHKGIGNLKELQTLVSVGAEFSGLHLMKDLENLTKLRWLIVTNLTMENGKALGSSVEKMKHLECLDLESSDDQEEIIDLQDKLSPPLTLRYLNFCGRLKKFPCWIRKLENLQMLRLKNTRLTDQFLKCLKGIPNLSGLYLVDAFDGERLHFEEGGFGKLKVLVLRELRGLKVVEVDEGALPVLEKLNIMKNPMLEKVFSNIQSSRNLKNVTVQDISSIRQIN